MQSYANSDLVRIIYCCRATSLLFLFHTDIAVQNTLATIKACTFVVGWLMAYVCICIIPYFSPFVKRRGLFLNRWKNK